MKDLKQIEQRLGAAKTALKAIMDYKVRVDRWEDPDEANIYAIYQMRDMADQALRKMKTIKAKKKHEVQKIPENQTICH